TWGSSNPGNISVSTTGDVSGLVLGGGSIISYTIGSCTAIHPMTVNPAPSAITGPSSVCIGSTISLSDASGGAWSSGSPAIAVIGSTSGVVTGIAAGTALITLTRGCPITYVVTVTTGGGPISGPSSVCVGYAAALTDAVAGGTWSC